MAKVFFELRTQNFELGVLVSLSVVRSPLTVVFIRAFATRRAFRYIFARFISAPLPNSRSPIPNPRSRIPFPVPLTKDAASIPNALGEL